MKTSCGKLLNLAHYFLYDVKLRLLAHSGSFLANQKARNAVVGAENLLNLNIFKWFLFLSYGTLVDFVKAIDCSVFRQDCCFGTLAVTVKFVILSTLAR